MITYPGSIRFAEVVLMTVSSMAVSNSLRSPRGNLRK
jgi:hypothetical protein